MINLLHITACIFHTGWSRSFNQNVYAEVIMIINSKINSENSSIVADFERQQSFVLMSSGAKKKSIAICLHFF